jgi:hypothetical protein
MWRKELKFDPLPALLSADDRFLQFFIERDLLNSNPGPLEYIWEQPSVRKILAKQQVDGSWRFKGKRPGEKFGEAYELLETWKVLRGLVEMYALDRNHPSIERACEYILGYQTDEGDIRGILSNQYAPYYTGSILEILIKAGYDEDDRILNGLQWLLDMRQEDGGWIIPLTMYKMQAYYSLFGQPPVPPERERPFSHMATGMVIRAFTAHPLYRRSPEAIHAGHLLKSRFFQKDAYTSRQAVDYWTKFQFPFWWTDLLTVMDSLMRMEFDRNDSEINRALEWFITHQSSGGLWRSYYGGASKDFSDEWVTLAVCQVMKYFLGD